MKDDRLHESEKASQRNHIIVKKIISTTREITSEDVTSADVYYLKYQLLQDDNSYELSEMSDVEFHKRITAIIGG